MNLDATTVGRFVDTTWARDILPALHDYIRIPNKSPAYDPDWEAAGHMERAVGLVSEWLQRHAVDGMTVEVHRLPGRTPLVVVDVPATRRSVPGTVLLYGHLDKQPEMTGWREGLGPWEPVVEGDRLYGRGGADDGYSAFAALTSIAAVREAGGDHARCVLLIEASEESGSTDLDVHVEALADRIGEIDLVVCLDSGCATFDRLWMTTTLRGIVTAGLRVDVLTEGIHSGASGTVASSFRILRSLLSRIEDQATGEMLLPELQVPVPAEYAALAKETAALLGDDVLTRYPLVDGARLMHDDPVEVILARTWSAALSITGAAGMPSLQDAGNVLRPYTALHLSLRLPPGCDPEAATHALRNALTADPPYGARVTVDRVESAAGWAASLGASPWFDRAVRRASIECFGNPPGFEGEGGSIPFINMLAERFPGADMLVTGVLGPGTNAHGPNEFLHVPTARKLTAAVAHLLAAHATREEAAGGS